MSWLVYVGAVVLLVVAGEMLASDPAGARRAGRAGLALLGAELGSGDRRRDGAAGAPGAARAGGPRGGPA